MCKFIMITILANRYYYMHFTVKAFRAYSPMTIFFLLLGKKNKPALAD